MPVEVTALGATVAEVALGMQHSCARRGDGTLWCWGLNLYGQLGNGTLVSTSMPVEVTALGTAVAEVALGWYHGCARKTNGTLWCWGRNDFGQVGDGTLVDRSSPVEVTALGAAVAEVALGYAHSCVRKSDGSAWCWGRNLFGQLGDGTTVDKLAPTPVATSCP